MTRGRTGGRSGLQARSQTTRCTACLSFWRLRRLLPSPGPTISHPKHWFSCVMAGALHGAKLMFKVPARASLLLFHHVVHGLHLILLTPIVASKGAGKRSCRHGRFEWVRPRLGRGWSQVVNSDCGVGECLCVERLCGSEIPVHSCPPNLNVMIAADWLRVRHICVRVLFRHMIFP